MSDRTPPWATMQMGEIGGWYGGGTPSKTNDSFWTGGTIPWVSPKDMKSDRIFDSQDHITAEAVENSSTNLVRRGSVLLVVRSGILKHTLPVAIADRDVALNQDLKAVLPHPHVISEYLALGIKAFEREILQTCTKNGTTVQSLDLPKFLRFPLPIASLDDQRRIVAEIQRQFTRLDAGVAGLRRVQANLKRYRASVLKAACEGRLVPTEAELARKEGRGFESGAELLERILVERREKWAGRGKYNEPPLVDPTSLPQLPSGWTWTTMPQIGDLDRGKSKHRPRDDARLYGGTYPFIQTGDVRKSNGRLLAYNQTYSDFGLLQSRLWPSGTMCITIAANIAETAILGIPACFPDSIVGFVQSGPTATTKFVEFFLRTAKEHLRTFAPATAQKNINLEILGQLAVPFPPLAEQIRIVAEVERRLSIIDRLEAAVEANLARAARLRQSVLQSAFTGKL